MSWLAKGTDRSCEWHLLGYWCSRRGSFDTRGALVPRSIGPPPNRGSERAGRRVLFRVRSDCFNHPHLITRSPSFSNVPPTGGRTHEAVNSAGNCPARKTWPRCCRSEYHFSEMSHAVNSDSHSVACLAPQNSYQVMTKWERDFSQIGKSIRELSFQTIAQFTHCLKVDPLPFPRRNCHPDSRSSLFRRTY